MADLMIDIETLATGPDATILTIAAQSFDPFGRGWHDLHYYARITLESQESRAIEQGTLDWWASQNEAAKSDAFAEEGRVALDQALDELGRLIWHSKRIWAQGPTFDCTILENAYKSYNKALPWKYHQVRDSRTVFSLCPDLTRGPVSHNSLEDCRQQIALLQDVLEYLHIKDIK